MSITSFYYNKSLRRIVILFGTLFNGYKIQKTDLSYVDVPLSYSSKKKWYLQIKQNADKNPMESIIFPRMGFIVKSIGFDFERKISNLNYFSMPIAGNANEMTKVFMPTPILVEFSLFIGAKTMEEGLQLVEQIIPYFDPVFNVELDELDSAEVPRDVAVTLTGLTFDNDFQGGFDGADLYTWDLSFSVSAFLYKNISSAKLIKKVVVDTHILSEGVGEETYKQRLTQEVDPFTAYVDDEWEVLESWGLVLADEPAIPPPVPDP